MNFKVNIKTMCNNQMQNNGYILLADLDKTNQILNNLPNQNPG